MSRVGKKPIFIPENVKVEILENKIRIEGPKGKLEREIFPELEVKVEGGKILVLPKKETKKTKALWGLLRQLIFNMVEGVTKGFEKKLEIVGLGWGAEKKENKIYLNLGRAVPDVVEIPEGIEVDVQKNLIVVSGIDKEKVGNFAAKIRRLREPDPYKGKGIRYFGEVIKLKPGKKAVAGKG